MAKYAYVNDGVVVEFHQGLPTSWRNISGFNLLEGDTSTLNSLGWYVVEYNGTEIDERTHKIVDTQYEVSGNSVIETPVVVELSQEEKDAKFQEFKNNFIAGMRGTRNMYLRDSDWTQATDLVTIRSEQWLDNWRTYRQTLRDLPNQYENLNTYEEFTPIVWPNIPVE